MRNGAGVAAVAQRDARPREDGGVLVRKQPYQERDGLVQESALGPAELAHDIGRERPPGGIGGAAQFAHESELGLAAAGMQDRDYLPNLVLVLRGQGRRHQLAAAPPVALRTLSAPLGPALLHAALHACQSR